MLVLECVLLVVTFFFNNGIPPIFSAQGRKNCLDGIIKAFSKKYLFDFLADR